MHAERRDELEDEEPGLSLAEAAEERPAQCPFCHALILNGRPQCKCGQEDDDGR